MKWMVVALLLVGCSGGDVTENESCESCLNDGGTWQPGSGCTEDCAIQDISCFRDECPGACEAGACGNCFEQSACEAASCEWKNSEEAFWCAAE